MSTGYSATVDGPAVQTSDLPKLMVRVWDLGPAVPEAPVKPALPTGKEGSPEHDLALIDFKGALADYETALKAFGQAKKDFAAWQATYGGPYESEMYSVDAREALAIAPDRYLVSDDRLPNHGLPKGRKAGKWHHEEKQRQEELRRHTARQLDRDPVFGSASQGAAS